MKSIIFAILITLALSQEPTHPPIESNITPHEFTYILYKYIREAPEDKWLTVRIVLRRHDGQIIDMLPRPDTVDISSVEISWEVEDD